MTEDPNPGPQELIVLVDEAGNPIGQAEKWASHHSDTPLHLAFSCYLFDARGRLLLTRRALTKKVWPGVWSNSVCGHPQPGETLEQAIERRLAYEVGMTAGSLEVALPGYRYRAPAFEGIVENEFCPVYLGRAENDPAPNPAEVEDFRWIDWPDFVEQASADAAGVFSWWCKDQLVQLVSHPRLSGFTRK